jgi:hypothetical protein
VRGHDEKGRDGVSRGGDAREVVCLAAERVPVDELRARLRNVDEVVDGKAVDVERRNRNGE